MKKSLPYLIILLLILLGVGAGIGASSGIRRLAALPEGEAVSSVTKPSATPRTTAVRSSEPRTPPVRVLNKKQYIDAILGRNIFDSEAAKAGVTSSSSYSEDEIPTDLNVTLIGTLVAFPERYSSALITEGSGEGRPRGYGLGDQLLDATIVAIERNKVTVERGNGQREVLVPEGENTGKSSTVSRSSRGSGSDEEGIEQVGENKFVIDRDLIDKYLGDLDTLARMGRALPHRGPDGQIDGYRMSGIRRRSLGEKIGIKNGDIVHSVNGQPLTSMQGAMSAYTTLQSSSSFSFEVTRRGQKMSMEYEIR